MVIYKYYVMIINHQYYCYLYIYYTWNNEMMYVENFWNMMEHCCGIRLLNMVFRLLKIKLYIILSYNDKKFIFLIKNTYLNP